MEFLTKFARHHCAVGGKRFLGVGVPQASKSGKTARASKATIDLTNDDQQAASIKQTNEAQRR